MFPNVGYYRFDRCCLLQGGFSVLWACTQRDAKLVIAPLKLCYYNCYAVFHYMINSVVFWRYLLLFFAIVCFTQEFEDSGDPEKHFQALLSLAKEGIEKGKVCFISSLDTLRNSWSSNL